MDNTAESAVESALEAIDAPIDAIENVIAQGAVADGEVVPDHGMMRVLEAMLFASAEPLSLGAMRERLPEGADVGGMLMALRRKYDGAGVSLIDLNGHWAFRTAMDLSDALMLKREVRRPLSRAAMETLAIIAYHQPVTRAEIENIRGVVISGGTIDILMEQGWVKPGRRREAPGRPLTWVTTTEFLDQFGLQALTDLPGLDELKASGLLDRRPAIETTTGDMFEQMVAEDEEAEAAEEDAAATEEELAALKAEREAEESAVEGEAAEFVPEDFQDDTIDESGEDADSDDDDDDGEDSDSDTDVEDSDDEDDFDDNDDSDDDEEDE
ncbi:MAG: SMC-Scp complex subunit ScpB [Micavibrio aeruginosavorus]|nr:SMC-Scp complex subunit ScpB [Micavibrio aeruginosavorus]